MAEQRADVDVVAWLMLRGSVDVRAFVAMPHGPERTLILAAQKRAEAMRVDEARQLARFIAVATGKAKEQGGGSNG